MGRINRELDFESVTRRGVRPLPDEVNESYRSGGTDNDGFCNAESKQVLEVSDKSIPSVRNLQLASIQRNSPINVSRDMAALKRGHGFTYVGLFLFTIIVYFRPYELIPALASLKSMAFWAGFITFAVYLISQILVEGNLTARPREVYLVLLFCLAGLLSVPLAISPSEAWATFTDSFVKAVLIFIVIVNAVRTERRLKGLLLLALAVSCVLSIGGLNDYRLGHLTVDETRIAGILHHGLFDNPNDLALHLVTIAPIAVGLLLATRNFLSKTLYATAACLMAATIIITFSRGGFLGLAAAGAVLGWKLGRRHHFLVSTVTCVIVVLFMALAPGGYGGRLSSIVHSNMDNGSATARTELLIRSIVVSLRHPLFGIGMGTFHIVGISEKVSHNAYTQVSAEMGMAALVIYIMFIISPLRRLREIERETQKSHDKRRFYYLSIALQASLVGYLVSSFFASVAYLWYIYYLAGYAVCFRRIYKFDTAEDRQPTVSNSNRIAIEEHGVTGLNATGFG